MGHNYRVAWFVTIGVLLGTSGCGGSGSDETDDGIEVDAEAAAEAGGVDAADIDAVAAVEDGDAADVHAVHLPPHQVVLDYSPTLSDVSTLLYLTQHPDIDLLAVTLAGTGESHCEPGVSNTIGLLELGGRPDVPVACGRTTPIGPGNEWPPAWRERSDALEGLDLPEERQGADVDAADLLASVASAQDDPVTIIAVGPLTNIAAALQQHEEFAEDVSRIVTMGGAMDVSGNAPNNSAEWNYFIDPTAVEIVLGSGIPITLVPLDATNDVPVTREWFDRLTRHHTTAAATAVYDLLSATPGWELGFSFWDELAAAVVVDPTLATYEDRKVVVIMSGEEAGRTRADESGATVRVAMEADTERFERELLTGLNAGADAPDPVAATPEEVAYFQAVSDSRLVVEDGISRLFQSPQANAIDEFMSEEPTTLTSEQELALRDFFDTFWSGAVDLIEVHATEVAGLDVPTDLRSPHEAYTAALDALVAGEAERLSTLDGLAGEELMSFLWAADADIERVEATCDELELQAVVRGLDVVLCPN